MTIQKISSKDFDKNRPKSCRDNRETHYESNELIRSLKIGECGSYPCVWTHKTHPAHSGVVCLGRVQPNRVKHRSKPYKRKFKTYCTDKVVDVLREA